MRRGSVVNHSHKHGDAGRRQHAPIQEIKTDKTTHVKRTTFAGDLPNKCESKTPGRKQQFKKVVFEPSIP
jgi:hypothetical protein